MIDPPPLFHGTRRGFTRGGYVFPASFHRAEPRPGNTGIDYAYATLDRDVAEWYAANTPGRGRAKVLTVVPLGPCEPDPSTYDGERGHQVRCRDGFRVIAVDIVEDTRAAS